MGASRQTVGRVVVLVSAHTTESNINVKTVMARVYVNMVVHDFTAETVKDQVFVSIINKETNVKTAVGQVFVHMEEYVTHVKNVMARHSVHTVSAVRVALTVVVVVCVNMGNKNACVENVMVPVYVSIKILRVVA